MTAYVEFSETAEYESRYTHEALEKRYGSFTHAAEEVEPMKEGAWFVVAAGDALDLMNITHKISNYLKELNSLRFSTSNSMSLVAIWAAIIFRS